MLVLGLENHGRLCSCALAEDDRLLVEIGIEHPEHSVLLPKLIDMALTCVERKLEEVDLYAISIGPGSFTSLRVGLSTFKAMALFHKKSIVSVSTLDALANEVDYSDRLVCPIIDAKRGEVYYATYRFNGADLKKLDGPEAIPLHTLLERLVEATIFLGSGVKTGKEILRSLGEKAICLGISSPRAFTICKLGRRKFQVSGGEDIIGLEPTYIKPSYVEVWRKLQIERMKVEHLDEVVKIENESFRYPWSRDAFAWEVNSQITLPVVGKVDGKVVGYLVIWMAYDEMHLGNIAVAKRWRRKGIGEKLMKWLIEEAKRRNVVRLTLEVRATNYPAISLYKKFGFKEVAVRKRYYPEGEDALVMLLDVKTR